MDFLRANPFIIGALTGSLAAYILGLIVSHFRRPKRWLGYRVSSRSIVQKGHEHLTLRYDDREIASLVSHVVLLQNIGNQPLHKQAVLLTVGDGGDILETDLLCPDGATVDLTRSTPRTLSVACDLLNPGEYFSVGITVADASDKGVQVVARGELLEVREIGSGLSIDSDLLDALFVPLPFGAAYIQLLRRMRRQRFLRKVT